MRDLKIFTSNIEAEALSQIYNLLDQKPFQNSKVRIMPDVHAGAGCVIGFTGNLGNKVIPNIVGVDIGCGMLTVELGKVDIDLKELDRVIRDSVPSGFYVHNAVVSKFSKIKELKCYNKLDNKERFEKSIGTLGGGNHFIEVDQDEEGNKYLIIHTGSRNLGKQVCEYYQNLAVDYNVGRDKLKELQDELVTKLKSEGKYDEIDKAIKDLKAEYREKNPYMPKELCYLEGQYKEDYLHDMKICQEFAVENRQQIALEILSNYFKKNIILTECGITEIARNNMEFERCYNSFETIHNYISFEDNIVRKGAISARKGEKVLIPINMRDGCIIGIGKGNEDWNQSAPHGAGRLMSRGDAKRSLNIEDFKDSMKGIYTTSVNITTLDEAPMAYKPMQEIIDNIGDTVEIIKIIKPIYNFKASEEWMLD